MIKKCKIILIFIIYSMLCDAMEPKNKKRKCETNIGRLQLIQEKKDAAKRKETHIEQKRLEKYSEDFQKYHEAIYNLTSSSSEDVFEEDSCEKSGDKVYLKLSISDVRKKLLEFFEKDSVIKQFKSLLLSDDTTVIATLMLIAERHKNNEITLLQEEIEFLDKVDNSIISE